MIETTNLTDEDVEERLSALKATYPKGDYPIGLFLKFTSDEFVDSFVNEGLLYMNAAEHFVKLEAKERGCRGDANELLTGSYEASQVQVVLDGCKLESLVGKVDLRYSEDLETKVFGLTVINHHDILMNKGEMYLSKEFRKFGNKVVLIGGRDIEKFIDRLKKAVAFDKGIIPATQNDGECLITRSVEYVPSTYSGRIGAFKKYDTYSWQHEWRAAFKHSSLKGPYKLKIGSIRDICTVHESDELLRKPILLLKKE